jgi:hypothetical protein
MGSVLRESAMESRKRKDELDRMAARLSRLYGRGYQVREEQAAHSVDFDVEERNSQQAEPLDALVPRASDPWR